MALWCMAHVQELALVALVVSLGCVVMLYVAGSVFTNVDILIVAGVALVGVLPVAIGVLYEFHLNLDRWFLGVDEDGKL